VLVAALAAALLLFGTASPALAGTFNEWQLNLWPEYDDPRLLVMFNGTLDPTVVLPYTLEYDIPIGAQMGMACQLLPDGAHDCQPQQSEVSDEIKTIAFSAPTERELYMEYYVDPMDGERPDQRQFTYSFTPPDDIDRLSVQVKQPNDSEDFVLEPAPMQTLTDAAGFSYLTYVFNDVKAGEPIDINFSYSRPTWVPPAGQDADPLASDSTLDVTGSGSNTLLWAVVGILVVIVFMMWRNQKAKA
jgi:hypothetical protein